jgi:hypothetical protein
MVEYHTTITACAQWTHKDPHTTNPVAHDKATATAAAQPWKTYVPCAGPYEKYGRKDHCEERMWVWW